MLEDERPSSSSNPDDIDLIRVIRVVWRGWWIIAGVALVFACGSLIRVFSKPNVYTAETLLVASSDDAGGGGGGQLAALAKLGGIGAGHRGKVDNSELALEVLKSRAFINEFIKKYKIEVPLVAGIGWKFDSGKWVLDKDVYDEKSGVWLEDGIPSEQARPKEWQLYAAFSGALTIEKSDKSPIVRIAITSISPVDASRWLDWIVTDLNRYMRERDIEEARRSISFLEQQIAKNTIAEMRSVFYQLVEEQTKTMMLAEVREGYVFRVVDPPVVPHKKSGPKRVATIILSTFLGVLAGIMAVFTLNFIRRYRATTFE